MEEMLIFYALDFQGKMPEEARKGYLLRGARALDAMCCPCPALRLEQEEALRYAICAAAEALYDLDHPPVLKEENGELKVTYNAALSADRRQVMAAAAYPYLLGTGLLYRGVRRW